MDYSLLLDRIMPEDKLDPDVLTKYEDDEDEVRKALLEKKLGASDETVAEVQLAASARLRFLGV